MAKTTDRQIRRRGQAVIRSGRQQIRDAEQRLREQRKELERARKEAAREALKSKKQIASLLRRLGVYKPKSKRITNDLVRKSGALQRKVREFNREREAAQRQGIPLTPRETAKVVKRRIEERREQRKVERQPTPLQRAINDAYKVAAHNGFDTDKTRDLIALIITRTDSYLKIREYSRRKQELFFSRRSAKDFTAYDYMLPDDWEIFRDEFPELFYYHSHV